MRENRLWAVIGLTRNSVTPASRAASTWCFSVWPVIMMIGTKGLGLLPAVRTVRLNSRPSIGFIARSLSTRSHFFSRSTVSAVPPLLASEISRMPAEFSSARSSERIC